MHRVRSLLALALASSLTALGLGGGLARHRGRPSRSAERGARLLGVQRSRLPGGEAQERGQPADRHGKSEATRALADFGFTTERRRGVQGLRRARPPGLVEVHRLYRPFRSRTSWPRPTRRSGEARQTTSLIGYSDDGEQLLRLDRSPPTACRRSTGTSKDSRTGCAASARDRSKHWSPTAGRSRASRSTPRLTMAPNRLQPPARADADSPDSPTPTEPRPDPDAGPDATGSEPGQAMTMPTTLSSAFAAIAGHPAGGAAQQRHPVHQPDASGWCKQKSALDLRFATHSGDVVNWDTPDHEQYEMASAGMKPLEAANIPYTLAIGNHDTMATGDRGRRPGHQDDPDLPARHPHLQLLLQRRPATPRSAARTSPARSTTSTPCTRPAGSSGWSWCWSCGRGRRRSTGPRTWSPTIPDHNVIVVTHDYLDGAGNLGQYGRLRRHQPAVPLRQPDQPVPEHQDDLLRSRRLRRRQGLHRQEREQDLLVPDHVPLRDHQPGPADHGGHQGGDAQDLDLRAASPTRPSPSYSKTITGVDFVELSPDCPQRTAPAAWSDHGRFVRAGAARPWHAGTQAGEC